MRLSQNQIYKAENTNDFFIGVKTNKRNKRSKRSSRSWKNIKKQAQWGHVISHAHIDPRLAYKIAMAAEDSEAYLGAYFPASPNFPNNTAYRFDELDMVWFNPNDNRLFNEGNKYYQSETYQKWENNHQ